MKSTKVVTVSLASAILFTAIAPSAAFASDNQASTTALQATNRQGASLEKALKEDNVSKEDWNKYVQQTKEKVANEPTERWKGAAVKKAMKFAVQHADTIPS